MYQGYVNALAIGGLGVLCALVAWQQKRLGAAWIWATDPLVRLVERVVAWVRRLPERMSA